LQGVVALRPPSLTVAENDDNTRSTLDIPHSGHFGAAERSRRWANISKI